MNFLLMMMGGKGVRFGADIPKQYTVINDRPIFSYIVQKYDKMPEIDGIVLVSHAQWISYVKEKMESYEISTPWEVVEGGSTRSESVLHGLQAAMKLSTGDDIVLIHDATHPYVDEMGTCKIIEAVKEFGGATLGGAEYDTMYQMDDYGVISQVIPRQFVVSGASPEAFWLREIYQIYSQASEKELEEMTSAGAIALAHDIKMKVIKTPYLNLKITHAEDMEVFKQLFDYFFSKKED